MASPLRFQIPHRIGAHRHAGLALFKALLTSCRQCQFDAKETLQITNVIKNRYRENRYVTSKNILSVVFRAGYQALDHFDTIIADKTAGPSSADGADTGSSELYMLDLLSRVPLRAKHPPRCDIDKIKLGKAARAPPGDASAEAPNEPAQRKLTLDDRPLPLEKLTGRRHIPRLVNACGVPMLRFRKPEPPTMGPFVAARLKQRDRRHRHRLDLEDQIIVAEYEDEWDDIVDDLADEEKVDVEDNDEEHDEGSDEGSDEENWQTEASRARNTLMALLRLELDKNTVMAAKMQDIIDKEKTLAKAENEERQKKRNMTLLPDLEGAEAGESFAKQSALP